MSQPWPTFGLTGGIACGKSTVARSFQDLGACIIDADRIGHELIEPGRAAYPEIVQLFGKEILARDGSIDRRNLGARVFAHPEEMRALNAALHPRIITRVEELARENRARHPLGVIIIDAALIFESGIGGTLRKVIVVWCRPEQQLERLMSKARLSREEAEQRIGAQMPPEEKRRRADYVIDCSGSKERAREQTQAIYPELERIVAEQ
jgi:dephospho-CoA kinase